MDLQDPVQYVKGVGPRRAAALARCGVLTVEDLLLPRSRSATRIGAPSRESPT